MSAPSTPHTHDPRPKLAVVGFESEPQGDPRDAWLPVAFEELLTRRLRRVPALIVIPTIRVHQGRQELQERDAPPAPWPKVARGLCASFLLSGRCSGSASEVTLELTLWRTSEPAVAQHHVTIPAGRLFDVLSQATQWVLARFDLAELEESVSKRVFAPPSPSPAAVEYHARALSAAREQDLSDALRHAGNAVRSDKRFRPALLLLAQLEMQLGPSGRNSAAARLRAVSDLARLDADPLDRAQAELYLSQVSQADGAFEAAYTRAETALTLAFQQRDVFAQMAVIDWISDLYLTRRPPPGAKLSDEMRQRFQRENLKRAAEWQGVLLEMLDALGDMLARLPATNKLALIYERLGEADQALEMHQRMLAAAKASGSRPHQATAWLFLGQWYRNRERWQEALDALSRCLVLADDSAKPAVRIALGGVYQAMALPEEALAQFELAYEQVRRTNDLASQFTCLRELARVRRQLGRHDAAIAALQDAVDIAHVLELAEEEPLRAELQAWKGRAHDR